MGERVSVIIPYYSQASAEDGLVRCLLAIRRQSRPPDEILVIGNDLMPVQESLPLEFPEVKFLHEPRPGSYRARNRGIQSALGETLAFIDADCTPDENWVQNGLFALDDSQELGIVAGRVQVIENTRVGASRRRFACTLAFEQMFHFDQRGFVNQFGFGATANLWVRRTVFDQVGLFSADLESGGDLELGRRAVARGIQLGYSESAGVTHRSRGSWGKVLSKELRTTGGLYKILKLRSLSQSGLLLQAWVESGLCWLKIPGKMLRIWAKPCSKSIAGDLRDSIWVVLIQAARSMEWLRMACGGTASRT